MKAIIGGTGIYQIDTAEKIQSLEIETPYGNVTVEQTEINGTPLVFLARHGKGHNTPPHMINYRANMMALKILGVTEVLATCAVGSCHNELTPGELVLISDFLDFTKGRAQTFFDGKEGVAHLEVSEPYCSHLKSKILNYTLENDIPIYTDAVYVCTEGPRFETAAEISMFKLLGGDVVGMTNFPEVVLAKELGLCYSAVGFVTNWCTGVKKGAVEMHDIEGSIAFNKQRLNKMFIEILTGAATEKTCHCSQSLIRL